MEEKNQIEINTEIKFFMTQVKEDIGYIKNKLDHLEDTFVTRKEFQPIQKIAYGLIGTIVTTVILALIYTVIQK